MFKKFLGGTRGNVSILFALSLVAILACVGIAVDYSRLSKEHSQIRQTLDSAVLAAAVEMSLEEDFDNFDLKATVEKFYDANKKETFGEFKVTEARYDKKRDEIIVNGEAIVPTAFMGILGHEEMVATAETVSGPIGRPEAIDIVLILDNTASIGYQDLNVIVSSSKELVDYVHDNKGKTDVRIGVVPFSRFVNVGAALNTLEWVDYADAYNPDASSFEGCVHPHFDDRDAAFSPSLTEPVYAAFDYAKYPYTSAPPSAQNHPLWWKYKWDTMDCNLSEITLLSRSRSAVKSKLDDIKGKTGGSTYLPVGLNWGDMVLNETSPLNSAPLLGKRRKIMIFMTDGGNKLYWIREQEYPVDVRTDEETDVLTMDLCASIKSRGTLMYTVAFKFDPSKEEFQRAAPVIDACASSTGTNYDPANAAELKEVFSDISDKVLRSDIRLIR